MTKLLKSVSVGPGLTLISGVTCTVTRALTPSNTIVTAAGGNSHPARSKSGDGHRRREQRPVVMHGNVIVIQLAPVW